MDLHIDGARLLRRLDELALIAPITGPNGERGNARLALTDEDRAGRDLVVSWMRDLGLDVSVDGIGNVIAVMTGHPGVAPVMTGSHIDTVATGGRFDGNLGVLAGLEVIESVIEAGIKLERPLAVGFFTDEEGARFAPDMLGSLVYAGGLGLEEALDIVSIDGARLGDELEKIGYQGGAPCPGPAPHAFVELHIEQGPVLEIEGFRLGAVTGVQGISWTRVTLSGQSNHAGTTPMQMRRDPAAAMIRIGAALQEIVADVGSPQVGTIGSIELKPNLINVVPARATFTVDVRHTDERTLRDVERRLRVEMERIAAEHGVELSTESLARFEPVVFDERVVSLVERAAIERDLSVMRLPSGAGHDAQMMARLCPTAMIFTPSRGGVSHNPAEHTDDDDLVAGCQVLADVMLALTVNAWMEE
ncbi:MAG: Zn-dependent hydrolase [Ilumatobacteraceae bacterium]